MKKVTFIVLSLFLNGLVFGQDKATILDSIFTSLYSANKFNGNALVAEKGGTFFEKSPFNFLKRGPTQGDCQC